ncbi:unnamed protein product [Kuraishia capsulata CBS 1993]|uniref:Uncharacterized protein n=1 Tax=Kuraishia capsulata CBS 1993 TaxID=1382522 RepID=W6MG83_9ASCO|nr:uncharacterized protein KUCA_T00000446001 [Kuraishia capsulata CBS 1993]CDK24483.1 unnamed protein product [Kuraishia capsulata CBS 1993]
MGSRSADGLSLLLNIQTCFHQVELLEQSTATIRTRLKWSFLASVLLAAFEFFQVIIALGAYEKFTSESVEIGETKKKCSLLTVKTDEIKAEMIASNSSTSATLLELRKEIAHLASRSTKGAEAREDLEFVHKRSLLGQPYQSSSFGHVKVPLAPLKWGNNIKVNSTQKLPVSDLVAPTRDKFRSHPQKKASGVKVKVGSESFDISTETGLNKWRDYMKTQMESKNNNSANENQDSSKSASTLAEDMANESSSPYEENGLVFSANTTEISKSANTEDMSPIKEKLGVEERREITAYDLRPVQTVDQNGKPYRRVFVPGYGWINARKLQEIRAASDAKEVI